MIQSAFILIDDSVLMAPVVREERRDNMIDNNDEKKPDQGNPNIRHLYDNVDLLKEDGRFYVLMGEEKLEINKEELLLILHDHELVFNVVINAKRKHDFNTFMDRYSPMEY